MNIEFLKDILIQSIREGRVYIAERNAQKLAKLIGRESAKNVILSAEYPHINHPDTVNSALRAIGGIGNP